LETFAQGLLIRRRQPGWPPIGTCSPKDLSVRSFLNLIFLRCLRFLPGAVCNKALAKASASP
jgi:hypothetical protein